MVASTAPHGNGRLQQDVDVVASLHALRIRTTTSSIATQTCCIKPASKSTASGVAYRIPRPDIFVMPLLPLQLRHYKTFQPPHDAGSGGAQAYKLGVIEAYDFLAPGHHPLFADPPHPNREHTSVMLPQVITTLSSSVIVALAQFSVPEPIQPQKAIDASTQQ